MTIISNHHKRLVLVLLIDHLVFHTNVAPLPLVGGLRKCLLSLLICIGLYLIDIEAKQNKYIP